MSDTGTRYFINKTVIFNLEWIAGELVNHILLSLTPRVSSDSVGLKQGPRICTSISFQVILMLLLQGPHLEKLCTSYYYGEQICYSFPQIGKIALVVRYSQIWGGGGWGGGTMQQGRWNLCILINVFTPFIFNVITDMQLHYTYI